MMRLRLRLLLVLLLACPALLLSQAATIPNLTTDTSPLGTDWMIVHKVGETRSKKQSRDQVCRIASSVTLPATCTVGDRFWDTDADTDGSLYICRATNVWKEVDDDGGAGGGGAPTDSQYLVLSADTSLSNERIYTTGVGLSGVDSGAGAAYTIGFWRGDTLASNPTYSSEDVVFTTDGTGGGLLFEGSTADAVEGILVWDPASTDKTITLPNVTGTVVTTGDTGTVTGAMIASSTIPDGDLTSNYSGVGACTGTDKVSTLNDNAAPTCTADDDTPDSDSEVPDAITLSGGTIAANTLTGAIKTSGLLDEGGQASVGATPHFLGIADGSVASPTTDPQPTVVFQRTDATSGTGIPFQFTYTKTDGTGFHYPLHVFVRNRSNKVSDLVAVSGSAYAEPTPLVTNLAATPSGSGGTLATATYGYYATAIVGGTEIVAGEHVDAAVTGPTGSVALTWTAVASATAYRVYRYVPATPDTAPVYFETASTSLTDTGTAGTSATGPSQTLWGGWWRVEKSATADSGRLAGGETDIINNSGRDPGSRPDRVGSTIGHQYVSAGNADNSIGIHLTGESDSQFHTGVLFDAFSFDQVGIDFSASDATKPAIRFANSQGAVSRNAAGTSDFTLFALDSADRWRLGSNTLTIDPTLFKVGILTASPDEAFEIETSLNGSVMGLVENQDAAGTGAIATWRAQADTAIVAMLAHGSARTTSRFGVAVGGYGEVLQTTGNGLLVGTSTAVPMILGTASAARLTIGADGNFTLGAAYLDLPQIAVPSNPAAGTRRIFVDSATSKLSVRTSAGATVSLEEAGAGGSTNAFGTIDMPSGTDPVAEAAPDTLIVTCGSGLICTGTAASDTLDFTLALADADVPNDLTVASSTSIATAGHLQAGSLTAGSASCLSVTSDRFYGDRDCDDSQDAGEEFIDQAGGSAADPMTVFDMVEDFVSASAENGELGTTGFSYSVNAISQVAAEANHPGIVSIATAATTSNVARIQTGSAGAGNSLLPTDVASFRWIIRPQSVSSTRIRVGLMQDMGNPDGGTAGVYFELDSSESPKWQVVTRQASTSTAVTCSGLADVTVNTWYNVIGARNGSGNWEFTINGTLCATNSTNLPTTALNYGAMIEARSAAVQTLEIDYTRVTSVELTR